MTELARWVLEFNTPGMDEPVQLEFSDEITIGRGSEVKLDLSSYRGAEKGVSRHHTTIFLRSNQLMVVDEDAANGTLLNDTKLSPHQPVHLANDDVLILGTLRLNVRVIEAPSLENVPRLQTDIDHDGDETPGRGELVLIVEDHIEVAQLFSMMLQKQGFVTQISRDSMRAMRFMANTQPDAVLLDLMLPGTNGIEVCKYIRRDSTLDHAPVIIVSARKTRETEQEAIEAGADVFLSKPVNAIELGKVVASYIKRRRVGMDLEPRERPGYDPTEMLETSESRRIADKRIRDDMVAIIVSGYVDKPFTVNLSKPVTFGRAKPNGGSTHIDLTRYNAKKMGVSREHMTLKYQGGVFFVEDKGSKNGTFVNNMRLEPLSEREVKSGQEIRLGDLVMHMFFSDNETSNDVDIANDSDTDHNGAEEVATSASAGDTDILG